MIVNDHHHPRMIIDQYEHNSGSDLGYSFQSEMWFNRAPLGPLSWHRCLYKKVFNSHLYYQTDHIHIHIHLDIHYWVKESST